MLRDYQEVMLAETREQLRHHRSVLMTCGCGSGKGYCTAYIINNAVKKGKHVLFAVYGVDRCEDMHARVTQMGVPHGVLQGDKKRERWHPVQVASFDTVYRMKHRPRADLIIIDECDQALSPTRREVLDAYPQSRILGMTASPMLGSGRALGVNSGGIFDAMVKGPSEKELIRQGWLVRSRVLAPPPASGMEDLKKKKTGEFDKEQGAAIADKAKVIGDVIEHWKTHGGYRKSAAFCFNKKHAFDVAEKFRSNGIQWVNVDESTSSEDRSQIWKDLDHGNLMGVSSVGVLSRGWDHSIVKHVMLLSKTASFPLYRQRLGRGSRPHPGHDHFLVSDHTRQLYVFEKEGPFFESEVDWQLDGDPIKSSEKDSAQRVSQCKRPVAVPDSGVPSWFRGEVSRDKKYMLCCYFTFAPGPDRCPRCGIPIEAQERKIEVEAGELKELTEEDRDRMEAEIRATSERKTFYLDLVKMSKARGYKDGYAPLVFKSKHGYWPPRGWKAEVEKIVGVTSVALDESEVLP